jgi:riboflavin biosynthesis pyrimidine reductase
MNRPKITLHIFSTLDGKNNYTAPSVGISDESWVRDYIEIHRKFDKKATFVGRTTAEEEYAHFLLPQIEQTDEKISREDFIADNGTSSKYLVALDSSGALKWTTNQLSLWDSTHVNHTEKEDIAHIIEVLSENVSDCFLAHLRKIGVSYIFGGKDSIDLPLVLAKLKSVFGIDEAIIGGGAILNGSFHAHGFIDELSLYLVPVIEGCTDEKTIVEVLPKFGVPIPVGYKLKNMQAYGNAVHLLYEC